MQVPLQPFVQILYINTYLSLFFLPPFHLPTIQVQIKAQSIHEELLQVTASFEGRPNLQLSVKPQNSSKVRIS